MRAWLLTVLVLAPVQASAEWQFKPFVGVTFAGSTTLLDNDQAVGSAKVAVGVSALLIGEIFGIEADVGRTSGFFQDDVPDAVVLQSSVSTFTGNVVVALPRRMTEYTLRPYVVGGVGVVRARTETKAEQFQVAASMPTTDIGGGVTGFLTNRIGLSWDVRYFRSFGGQVGSSSVLSPTDPERLSFWRANMALAIRLGRSPQ